MKAYLVDILDSHIAGSELSKIGVSATGRMIMGEKLKYIIIKLKNINATALNILKQEALGIGAEVANHKDVITGKIPVSDSILFGTPVQLRIIVKKIKLQQFGLKELSNELENILSECDKSFKKNNPRKINTKIQDKDIVFNGKTYIMGILNVTPDSFSDGGKFYDYNDAVKRGIEIEKEGGDIIDVGGESTRPYSEEVDIQTEIDRVCPVIEKLSKTVSVPISVDTRKPEVAKEALKAGASIINDVSGLSYEAENMAKVLLDFDAPYIMMHSREKKPEDMPANIEPYGDIFFEILGYFKKKLEYLELKGYNTDNVIIDPGFGFAKTLDDNYNILSGIISFKSLGKPLLAGVSRKSLVKHIVKNDKSTILSGSIALASYLKIKGVDIIRVHDVKQTFSALSLLEKINL